MFKKSLSLALVSLLMLSLTLIPAVSAQNESRPDAAQQAKLKAKLAKIGTGKQAKVEVTLRDSSKQSGFVSQLKEESIILTDAKTGATTELSFANIADAKKRGISTGAKIALIGLGAAVLGIVIFFKTCGNPDVCG